MTPRIQKSIDIFLDAINEGTLAKGTCAACAVGNLVAHGMGAKVVTDKQGYYRARDSKGTRVVNSVWNQFFMTDNTGYTFSFLPFSDITEFPDLQKAIDNIGFTLEELAKIEYAFETNTRISYDEYCEWTPEEIRADQIRGLEAVVQVMLQFDEQQDDVKEVFTSKAKLIPC